MRPARSRVHAIAFVVGQGCSPTHPRSRGRNPRHALGWVPQDLTGRPTESRSSPATLATKTSQGRPVRHPEGSPSRSHDPRPPAEGNGQVCRADAQRQDFRGGTAKVLTILAPGIVWRLQAWPQSAAHAAGLDLPLRRSGTFCPWHEGRHAETLPICREGLADNAHPRTGAQPRSAN